MLDLKKLLSTIGQAAPPMTEVQTTAPNLGMEVQRRPDIPLPSDPNVVQQAGDMFAPVTAQPAQQTPLPQVVQPPQVTPMTDLQKGEAEVARIAAEPAKKQNPWLQGLFLALQGISKTMNPRDDSPVQLLGNAKKQYNLDQALGVVKPLREQATYQQQQLKAQQDARMGGLEYQLKINKGLQDQFNNDPDILLIKESKRVTPEQAARLNKKFGSSYEPAYWGSFIEKESNGEMYVRPSDRPNYAKNTSIAPNLPETTVSVPLSGGGTGYTTSKNAVGHDKDVTVAGITANRQVAIADADNEIEVNKTNAKAINDYRKETTDFLFKRQAALAALGKDVPKNVQTYSSQLAKDEAEYDKANSSGDLDGAVTAYNKYLKTLDSLNKAMEAAGKSDAEIKSAIDAIPMPQKPALVKQTKINMGGSATKPKKDTLKLF